MLMRKLIDSDDDNDNDSDDDNDNGSLFRQLQDQHVEYACLSPVFGKRGQNGQLC